jgi:glycerophosphoryl diester phosphodiesterase family protein
MSGSGFDTPPPPPPPMPQGGSPGGGDPLPTRGLGDILSAAFTIYKAHALQLMVIVAVIVVPLQFIGSLLNGVVFDAKTETVQSFGRSVQVLEPRSLGLIWLSVLVGVIIAVIITAMLQAAVLRAAAQATIGDEVDATESYRFGFRKVGSVIWLSILVGLATVSILILGVLLAFAVKALGFLVIIVGVVFAVWASVSLFASIPALVVEDKRGTEAMKRSWNLVKGDFWHVLGTIFVAGLIVGLVSGIVTGLGGSNWVTSWIFGSIARVITAPFTALVAVLLYLDLRARKEGLTASTLRGELHGGE